VIVIGLVAAAALALAALAVEVISRMWLKYRRRYYVFPPGLRLQVHPDREVFPQLPHTARFIVNRDGERGDEVPASSDGLYRILVAGGSQPEGYFLDQDSTWPGAMQRLLESPDRLARLRASKVHVGCIARSGIGSEGLDVMFSRILPQYPRLQLIVTLVGVTDVMRWIEQGTPDVTQPVTVADVFRCHPDGPFGWTPRQLATTELLLRARRRWLRPINVDAHAGRWIGRARRMRANAHTIREAIGDPSSMLDRFDRHFRRVLTQAKAHADRVLVVRQPWFHKQFSPEELASMWHGGIGQAWREEVTTYYALETFAKVMATLDARAAAIARSFDVEQLDLMPILEPSLRTYYDAFHLTDYGAMQVANAVGATILREEVPRWQPLAGMVPTQSAEALRAS
jgi:hypothetical protein